MPIYAAEHSDHLATWVWVDTTGAPPSIDIVHTLPNNRATRLQRSTCFHWQGVRQASCAVRKPPGEHGSSISRSIRANDPEFIKSSDLSQRIFGPNPGCSPREVTSNANSDH